MLIEDSTRAQFAPHLVEMLYLVSRMLQEYIEKVANARMEVSQNKPMRELRAELQKLNEAPSRFGIGSEIQDEMRQTLATRHGNQGSQLMSTLASYTVQSDTVVSL
eukprot:6963321-Prymnesium_polylepis.1